jgi:CheY-like chemotaxis protein
MSDTEIRNQYSSQVSREAQIPATILYVEDNSANLELVSALLARRGNLTLISATTGPKGVELARLHQPALILMDIKLPCISGSDALRILRDDPATAHIPVIALSSNALLRSIEQGLEAGFYRYLTKPFKIDEFMDAVEDALRAPKILMQTPNPERRN